MLTNTQKVALLVAIIVQAFALNSIMIRFPQTSGAIAIVLGVELAVLIVAIVIDLMRVDSDA